MIVSVIAAEALLRKTISKKHKVKRKSFFLVLQISSVQAYNKMISGIRDEPESKLFIERILQPFIELFSEHKQHN
ncbi:hypothetical protein [Wolbachia endosymbiont of Protocalliphora sialia]